MHKKGVAFEDIFNVERLTRCDYSARRDLIAWSSTHSAGIVLQGVKGDSYCTIASKDTYAKYPVFSPDDRFLLYLTQKDEHYQMMVYSFDTDSVACVLIADSPIIDPRWSPDSKYILYASVQHEKDSFADAAEPIVIEDLGYKFDGIGFRKPSNTTQLFVLELGTLQTHCVTSGMCDFLHHNWCPDNLHVICVSNKYRPGSDYLGYDLLRIHIQTGEITKLTDDLWLASYPSPIRPVCTPDSQYVIAGVLDGDYSDSISTGSFPQVYLYRIRLDGTAQERIFYPNENCYQCAQFPYNAVCGCGMDTLQIDESGRYVFFHSGWQGQGGLFRMDLSDQAFPVQPIDRGTHAYHGISRIQNGKMIAARCSNAETEGYYLINIESGAVENKLVQSASDYLRNAVLSIPQDFFVPTSDGTDLVHGWVLPPADLSPEKKYPAILYIHGGPHPFYTYAVDLEMQAFAAKGFAVLYCNPRGSTGYGWTHQNWGDARCKEPFDDCMDFVDGALQRFSWLDSSRLGVTGGSYGGYMTNYIATHSSRFRAYVCQRGLFNDQILYASSDETGSSARYPNFRQFLQEALEKSAVAYAERIQAPYLILHGADDCRTPVEGAVQMHSALRDVHPEVPVKLVLYPHTGHSQPQTRDMLLSYYQEMLHWFRTYLLPIDTGVITPWSK